MSLNTLDLFIIGLVTVSALFGLFRGFTTSVLSLFTWLVALWLPFKFTPEFSLFLPDTVESPTARTAIAAATLFLAAFVMLNIISWMLRKLMGLTGLGVVDRLFGAGLGVIRGVMIAAILGMLASYSSTLPKEKWWGESKLMPYVLQASDEIRDRMPSSLANLFGQNRL